jgi:hypothetical protein
MMADPVAVALWPFADFLLWHTREEEEEEEGGS